MPTAPRVAKTKKVLPQKTERIDARLRSDQKERIEMAACLRGLSVSDFVIQHADDAAKKVIENDLVWSLRGEAAKAFVEAITNSPEPGPNLKAAFKRYSEERGCGSVRCIDVSLTPEGFRKRSGIA